MGRGELLWLTFATFTLMSPSAASAKPQGESNQFLFRADQSNSATLFNSVRKESSVNKLHCAFLCSQRPDCLTYRFAPDTSACLMSNEEPGGLGSGVAVYTYGLRKRSDLSPCKRVLASTVGRLSCPIQQRVSDTVSFQQSWSSYQNGFGDDTNFWIGLKGINQLTSPSGVTFTVDFVTWSDQWYHQEYSQLYVADSSANYKLTYNSFVASNSNYSNDQFYRNNGYMFSTMDVDNDILGGASCSLLYHGSSGWWFRACTGLNPNGIYANSSVTGTQYMFWGDGTAVKAVRLSLWPPAT